MPRAFLKRAFATTAAAIVTLACVIVAHANETVMLTRKGASYDDVRFDLENAIISAGLNIDFKGNIAAMLQRTGRDVGSNQPIYKNAEFFTFCSAKLSRAMMEADPAHMGNCPYVVFIYERAGTYKEVVVGYRKIEERTRGNKAIQQINKLLDEIIKTAAKR